MTKIDASSIDTMFDYLSKSSPLNHSDWALVFGRADRLVADKTEELLRAGLVDYAMIVGGIGKDSGSLARLAIPEAHYLGALLVDRPGFPVDKLYVEAKPTNGGECLEMGLGRIANEGLAHNGLTLVIHPTSLRRIMAQCEAVAGRIGFTTKHPLQGVGTDYEFDPERLIDQKEAAAELLRLADWPAKGWCVAQNDLPLDLVETARAYDSAWKAEKK